MSIIDYSRYGYGYNISIKRVTNMAILTKSYVHSC